MNCGWPQRCARAPVRVKAANERFVDTAGTARSAAKTFNISTGVSICNCQCGLARGQARENRAARVARAVLMS